VTDELNALKVFETLNARGVQLSSSDLLKNYIFSVADSADLHKNQMDYLEDEWAKIADIKTSQQAFTLLNDLEKKADLYVALQNPADEFWKNKQHIQEQLELLQTFNVRQPFSLLLSAYSALPEKEFESLLKISIL
jgi:uncharacterized protein with ParB-like and HNH nuclease domain